MTAWQGLSIRTGRAHRGGTSALDRANGKAVGHFSAYPLEAVRRLPTGQRRFSARDADARLRVRTAAAARCAVYGRVSSGKQAEAGKLERQKERLMAADVANGYEVAAMVAEQASGLYEKRRGLRRLFRLAASSTIDGVRITFKDRLARCGFGYRVEPFAAHGVRVEVREGPVATDATQDTFSACQGRVGKPFRTARR